MLAYHLPLPFVLMPGSLGLFWCMQLIIYKYIRQQNDILEVIQNEDSDMFPISGLAPFGTTRIISACQWNKSRNKCNRETKYFFLHFPFWLGKIILKMDWRKRGKEGMENRALFLFSFLDLSSFLIGLKADLFCKEEPITCSKHAPGLSSMTAGFSLFSAPVWSYEWFMV